MEAKQVNLGVQFYNPYGFVALCEYVFNYSVDCLPMMCLSNRASREKYW